MWTLAVSRICTFAQLRALGKPRIRTNVRFRAFGNDANVRPVTTWAAGH